MCLTIFARCLISVGNDYVLTLEMNKEWLALSTTPRPYIVDCRPATLADVVEMLDQTAEFLMSD